MSHRYLLRRTPARFVPALPLAEVLALLHVCADLVRLVESYAAPDPHRFGRFTPVHLQDVTKVSLAPDGTVYMLATDLGMNRLFSSAHPGDPWREWGLEPLVDFAVRQDGIVVALQGNRSSAFSLVAFTPTHRPLWRVAVRVPRDATNLRLLRSSTVDLHVALAYQCNNEHKGRNYIQVRDRAGQHYALHCDWADDVFLGRTTLLRVTLTATHLHVQWLNLRTGAVERTFHVDSHAYDNYELPSVCEGPDGTLSMMASQTDANIWHQVWIQGHRIQYEPITWFHFCFCGHLDWNAQRAVKTYHGQVFVALE